LAHDRAKQNVANAEVAVNKARKHHGDAIDNYKRACNDVKEAKKTVELAERALAAGKTYNPGVFESLKDDVTKARAAREKAKAAEPAAAAAVPIVEAELVAARTAEVAAMAAKDAAKREELRIERATVQPAGPGRVPTLVQFLAAEYAVRTNAVVEVVGSQFRDRLEAFARGRGDDPTADMSPKDVFNALKPFGVAKKAMRETRNYVIPWATVRAQIATMYPTAVPAEDAPVVPVVPVPSKVAAWLARAYVTTGDAADAVGSTALRDAYIAATGDPMSPTAFGREMNKVHGHTEDKKRQMRIEGHVVSAYLGLRPKT